jgi:predicted nucleic acid-binding Zn finger protein
MRTYAESTVFSSVPNADGSNIVIEVPSKSNPKKMYRVDLTNGRCDCPAWKFQRGHRSPCKHLKDLGYYDIQQDITGQEIVAQPAKVKTPLTEEQKKQKAVELAQLEDQI